MSEHEVGRGCLTNTRNEKERGGLLRLPGLNEARRGAIHSRRHTYETSTLRNDG